MSGDPIFQDLRGGRVGGAIDGVAPDEYVTVRQLKRQAAWIRRAAVGAVSAALGLVDATLAVVVGQGPGGANAPISGAAFTAYGTAAPGISAEYDLGTQDNGWRSLYLAGVAFASVRLSMADEEVILNTGGAVTDSGNAALLPANSDIRAVMVYTTQQILGGGVASISVGDAGTPTRFVNASAALLVYGARDAGIRHLLTGGITGQAADAPVRITANGGVPTQGRVRLVRVAMTFTPPRA